MGPQSKDFGGTNVVLGSYTDFASTTGLEGGFEASKGFQSIFLLSAVMVVVVYAFKLFLPCNMLAIQQQGACNDIQKHLRHEL